MSQIAVLADKEREELLQLLRDAMEFVRTHDARGIVIAIPLRGRQSFYAVAGTMSDVEILGHLEILKQEVAK